MAAVSLLVALFLSAINAQSGTSFRARLSPLPVTGATVNTITGAGSVTATLQGSRLAIEGTFSGLSGPATSANVRRGARAIPGPVVFELTVPAATSGHGVSRTVRPAAICGLFSTTSGPRAVDTGGATRHLLEAGTAGRVRARVRPPPTG